MSSVAAPSALEAFVAGPADPAAADRAAAGAPEAALLAAVAALQAARQSAHLAQMGRPSFSKEVRKAAKKAAYQLKSAGVAVASAPRAAAVTTNSAVKLDGLALVGAPGLAGRYWLLLAELPDAAPVAIETDAWGGAARVTVFERMSPGKLRHYEREMRGEALPGMPIVAHADLGLAMVAHIAAAVRDVGGAFPPGWAEVLWWCERARGHGADPGRADAARALGAAALDLPPALIATTGALIERPDSGPHVPEQAAIDALITRVLEVADRPDALTEDELRDRLEGLADSACDAYFARAAVATQRARALTASADVLHACGEPDLARQLLWLADQLSGGARLPHELGLLSQAFRRIINFDLVWQRHVERCAAEDHTAASA